MAAVEVTAPAAVPEVKEEVKEEVKAEVVEEVVEVPVVETNGMVEEEVVEAAEEGVLEGGESLKKVEFAAPEGQTGEPGELDEDLMFDQEEKRLKQVYEENVDVVITELEQGNYFLGYDNLPSQNKFLTEKKVVTKLKVELDPYGEAWAKDVFSLGHNTVKSEIKDMYNIVRSMEKMGMTVNRKTIQGFYEWWILFLSVFTIVLDMEDDVIYPWVESKVSLEGTGMSKRERMAAKKQMSQLLNTINAQETKMKYIPPGEVAHKFMKFINDFVPVVLSYMKLTQRSVVPLVEKSFSQQEYQQDLVPFMSKYLHEYQDWAEVAPVMTAWMSDRQSSLYSKNFVKMMEKMRFSGWKRAVNRTHYAMRDGITQQDTDPQVLLKALAYAERKAQ